MDFLRVDPSGKAKLPEALPGGGVVVHSAEVFNLEFGEMKSVATGFEVDIPEGSALLVQETHAMGIAGVSVIGGLYTAADTGELVVNLSNSKRAAFSVSVGSVIGIAMLVDVEEFDVQEVDVNGDVVKPEESKGSEERNEGKKNLALTGVVETPENKTQEKSRFLDPTFKPAEEARHGQPNTNPQNVGVGKEVPPHSEPVPPAKPADSKTT